MTPFESLPEEVQERLAELEHIQWAHWTKYILENLTPENIERWRKQIETPYSELSEVEKEADRKWARKVVEAWDSSTLIWSTFYKELKEALWPAEFGGKEK